MTTKEPDSFLPINCHLFMASLRNGKLFERR